MKVYVIKELRDGKWEFAYGGGSSTTPRLRAYDNLTSANRAMSRLVSFPNDEPEERKVVVYTEDNDD